MLTTHYTDLCKKLQTSSGMTTYRMKVNVPEKSSESMEYLYKIEDGINEIDGGIEVLRQMQYPLEILDKLADKT